MSGFSDLFNNLPDRERLLFRIIETQHRLNQLSIQNQDIKASANRLVKKNVELMNRLMKQLEADKAEYTVTTTASPDSETTLEVEKNVTNGDERSSDD